MTIWASQVDLRNEFQSYKEHGDIKQLAKDFSIKLKTNQFYESDLDYQKIVKSFESMSNKKVVLEEDINSILTDLYDWADQEIGESKNIFNSHKKCWVKTFF